MKLRGPAGAGEVGHQGAAYRPDSDGVYDVPEALGELLKGSYGFRDHTAPEPAAPSPTVAAKGEPTPFPPGSVFPPRAEMLRFLKEHGIAVAVVGTSNEALAQLVREHIFDPVAGDPVSAPEDGEGTGAGTTGDGGTGSPPAAGAQS